MPVVNFHLAPQAHGDWAEHEAAFGKGTSQKQTIYGNMLPLLLTAGGVILDFELAPAHATDLVVGEELLDNHTDMDVFGDKAYLSAPMGARLRAERRVRLHPLPRRNQRVQVPDRVRQLINRVRQISETVNDQLTEQFNLEHNHAHSCCGLCTRVYTTLAAHTRCIYLNRLLGNAEFLQIKHLAFPTSHIARSCGSS